MNELSYEEHLYIAEKLYECEDFLTWVGERLRECNDTVCSDEIKEIYSRMNQAVDVLSGVDSDLLYMLTQHYPDIADDYVYPEAIDSRKKYLGTGWHLRLKWERDYG